MSSKLIQMCATSTGKHKQAHKKTNLNQNQHANFRTIHVCVCLIVHNCHTQ